MNISKTILKRILHKDRGRMPYRVQLVQQLEPIDHPMRFRIAKWACDRLTEDLGGYVNKPNYRIWGTENPHAFGADFGPEA